MEKLSRKRASSAEVPVLVPVAEMDEKPAEGLAAMGSATSLSKNERPRLPDKFYKLLTKPRLKAIKQYIESFQYRLNVQTNFNAHKLRPLSRIMDTARMIVYAPQPIKCVEAVFVALYLTAGLLDVERVPLGFKTELNGQEYQHIVLLVQHEGKYGAFGISRCPDLMNKDLIFNSMSSVIENFKLAYEEQQHSVLKVRIGLPVEHNLVSPNFVCWRHLNLNLQYESWPQCVEAIEKHAVKGKRLWDLWILAGKGEDPQKNSSPRKAPLDNRYYGYDSAKKKLITSHELSPLKVKSIMYGDHSFAGESSTSGIPIDDPTGTQTSSLRKQYDANINAELSVPKKCLETKVIAPFPTAVGNSRFRRTEKASEKGLTQVDTLQARKMMRDVVQPLPRLARGFDQTLAVNRSFLRTKSFKGTSNTVVRSPTHGPKVSARRKMVIMGRSTLIARIPARLHCQTFDGDTLFPRHPHR